MSFERHWASSSTDFTQAAHDSIFAFHWGLYIVLLCSLCSISSSSCQGVNPLKEAELEGHNITTSNLSRCWSKECTPYSGLVLGGKWFFFFKHGRSSLCLYSKKNGLPDLLMFSFSYNINTFLKKSIAQVVILCFQLYWCLLVKQGSNPAPARSCSPWLGQDGLEMQPTAAT